jgi:hypothetical protein
VIEFALAAHLLACPAVTTLVGSRIYAEQADQEMPRPLIVHRLLPGSVRHYHSQGASGLVEADIEITCRADNYNAARILYEAIRNEVDGFRGEWDGTVVNRAVVSPPFTGTLPPIHGDEAGAPSIKARLSVHYYESIPIPTFAP